MKYTIKIIYGKEQVIKFYNNEPFSNEEKLNNLKEYKFNSKEELDAFCFGVNETIGWTECHILESELA